MSSGRTVPELLRDFQDATARAGDVTRALRDRLCDYRRFVQKEGHLLARFPDQLFPLALAQPRDTAVSPDALTRHESGRRFSSTALRWAI